MIYFESNFMVSQNNIILYTWYLSNSLSLKIICLLHPLMRHTVFFISKDPLYVSSEYKNLSKMQFLVEISKFSSDKFRFVPGFRALLKSNVCPLLYDGLKIKQFMVFRLRQAYCRFAKMRFYQFRNNL